MCGVSCSVPHHFESVHWSTCHCVLPSRRRPLVDYTSRRRLTQPGCADRGRFASGRRGARPTRPAPASPAAPAPARAPVPTRRRSRRPWRRRGPAAPRRPAARHHRARRAASPDRGSSGASSPMRPTSSTTSSARVTSSAPLRSSAWQPADADDVTGPGTARDHPAQRPRPGGGVGGAAAQARLHHHRRPDNGGDQPVAGQEPVPGRTDTGRIFGEQQPVLADPMQQRGVPGRIGNVDARRRAPPR